jgi:hypothetical protein
VLLLLWPCDERWIEKWEDIQRLTNFRAETIPSDHELYERRLYLADGIDNVALAELQALTMSS